MGPPTPNKTVVLFCFHPFPLSKRRYKQKREVTIQFNRNKIVKWRKLSNKALKLTEEAICMDLGFPVEWLLLFYSGTDFCGYL